MVENKDFILKGIVFVNDLATFLLHKFTFFCVTSFYAFVLICPHKRFIHSRFKNISAFLFLFSTDF